MGEGEVRVGGGGGVESATTGFSFHHLASNDKEIHFLYKKIFNVISK